MSLKLEHVTRIVDGHVHIDDACLSFEPGSFNVLLGRTLALHGDQPPVEARSGAPVDTQLFQAGRTAQRDGAEIKEIERQRLFELVGVARKYQD